jgi:putative Holliday junction resolvase
MSLISLDLGEKKVGIAISRSGIIAEPLTTLDVNDNFFQELKTICLKEDVNKIIIGLPRSLHGKRNIQENKIRAMADKIKNDTKIEVELVDETYTTKMAKERFDQERIDEEAACIILESYLNSKNK